MTIQQEDVIRMAREAGSPSAEFMPDDFKGLLGVFTRFAELVAAHEREECAKVCEKGFSYDEDDPGETFAAAIRARGTP